jgi:hypothetical protein
MILSTLLVPLALAGSPVPPAATCEHGRLVTVRTLERSEVSLGGPSPAGTDQAPPSSARGALHFLTFQCGDRTWQARAPEGTPGLRREDLRPRDDVAFRVEDGKLYMTRADGTRLVLRVSKPRPAPEPGKVGPARE